VLRRKRRFVAMRCAGFDRVDLTTCAKFGIAVARVPTYSPHSVAEHAVAMLMCLNRQGLFCIFHHLPMAESSGIEPQHRHRPAHLPSSSPVITCMDGLHLDTAGT
jgi:hypothetical protein